MNVDDSARTMFARHKLGGSKEQIQWLQENRFIAIHWENSPSVDETDYGDDGRSRAYQEIRRIRRVARKEDDPVIVGAYYGNRVPRYRNSMLIGRVDPDSDVKIIHLRDGTDPIVYDSEHEAREAGVPDAFGKNHARPPDDDESLYKALPLVGCQAYDEPKEVSLTDYPLLSAVRPRHHSFSNWYAAQGHLRAIDAGINSFRDIEASISDPSGLLAPSQLEVLCNEYLRVSEDFTGYTPILPVGRTMRDVDIVGQFKGRKLFAQVTKSTGADLEDKAEKLSGYSDRNSLLLLFGPDGEDEAITIPRSVDQYISVKDVVEIVDEGAEELLDVMYELPEPL